MDAYDTSSFSFTNNDALKRKRADEEPVTALVVDDEDSVRKFVDRVLREAGYKTALASDGPEAIEVAEKLGPFEILVTDVMMPKMNGDELARRVRQAEPAVKVLYLTGYADRLFKEKTTLWEGEAFLDKPCSVKGLLEAVSLLIYGKLNGRPSPAA
jgi:two-component system cell cycle sensor histidine kinase/response regulator CckA